MGKKKTTPLKPEEKTNLLETEEPTKERWSIKENISLILSIIAILVSVGNLILYGLTFNNQYNSLPNIYWLEQSISPTSPPVGFNYSYEINNNRWRICNPNLKPSDLSFDLQFNNSEPSTPNHIITKNANMDIIGFTYQSDNFSVDLHYPPSESYSNSECLPYPMEIVIRVPPTSCTSEGSIRKFSFCGETNSPTSKIDLGCYDSFFNCTSHLLIINKI